MSNIGNYHSLLLRTHNLEGGYTRGSTVDPETIMGATIDTLPLIFRHVSERDKGEMSPVMRSFIDRYDARGFARYIGGNLEPLHGDPSQTSLTPKAGLDPWELKDIQIAQQIIEKGLFQEYFVKPGFVFDSPDAKKNVPRALIPYLADASINLGAARSYSILGQAMHEAGMGDKKIPLMTIEEMLDPSFYSNDRRGQAYASADTRKHMIAKLSTATPDQIGQIADSLYRQRGEYNTALSALPGFEPYADGLRNRNDAIQHFAQRIWPGAQPRQMAIDYDDPDPVGTALQIVTDQSSDPVGTIINNLEYGYKVQYRHNGISGAIAIELPGYGLVMYDVDDATNRLKGDGPTKLPKGLRYNPYGGVSIEVDGKIVAGGVQKGSITREDGSPIYEGRPDLVLSPDQNLAVKMAALPRFLGTSSPWYTQRVFEVSSDGKHLEGQHTDLMFVGDRPEVRDKRSGDAIPIVPITRQYASSEPTR